ncbi:MAG: hypothetical protein JWP01_2168 [Myxococcales bacterium]|nr:hypothetical protein [Myxococcales bacterium]
MVGSLGIAGCAAGYGVGYTSLDVGPTASPRAGFPEDQSARLSTSFQEFRIIDSTGLLLAGLVNAGRQHNARADALAEAEHAPRNPDGTVTVSYSYDPMPIISGLLTDLRIRLGFTPDLELPPGSPSNREVDYWAFDLRPEFYTFRPVTSLPLVGSLFLSVKAEQWKAADVMGIGFSVFEIDMLGGGSASYVFGKNLVATGRVSVGLLSPLLGAISGGTLLNTGFEAEVGWRPFTSNKVGVMVSGVAYYGREFAIDRSASGPRVGLNVALAFGNQAKGYKPKTETTPPPASETPTGAAAATQPQTLSGNVCVGDVPACKAIMTSAPEPVKTLFVACAQATITAADGNAWTTQPETCRTAGRGIASYRATNAATMDEATTQVVDAAAAASFDFAGVGYEVTAGRLTAPHCAMIELTFNHVLGKNPSKPALPEKVKDINALISQCRLTFTCATAADGDLTCAPK